MISRLKYGITLFQKINIISELILLTINEGNLSGNILRHGNNIADGKRYKKCFYIDEYALIYAMNMYVQY